MEDRVEEKKEPKYIPMLIHDKITGKPRVMTDEEHKEMNEEWNRRSFDHLMDSFMYGYENAKSKDSQLAKLQGENKKLREALEKTTMKKKREVKDVKARKIIIFLAKCLYDLDAIEKQKGKDIESFLFPEFFPPKRKNKCTT